jgi:hypothetical protein
LFAMAGRGLSVRDIVMDCLSMWYVRLPAHACSCMSEEVKARAMADVNASLQIIYSRARHLDYFNATAQTYQVPAGGEVQLPVNIQTVLGQARWKVEENSLTSRPLMAIASLPEAQRFGDLYGSLSVPAGYYIDRRRRPEANSSQAVLMVAPAQANVVYVELDVALEAPRYTWRDVEVSTPVEMPATYAESLLMPIVRHRAMSYHKFSQEQLRSTIEQHYRKAQAQLGLLDPAPNQGAMLQTRDVEGREP